MFHWSQCNNKNIPPSPTTPQQALGPKLRQWNPDTVWTVSGFIGYDVQACGHDIGFKATADPVRGRTCGMEQQVGKVGFTSLISFRGSGWWKSFSFSSSSCWYCKINALCSLTVPPHALVKKVHTNEDFRWTYINYFFSIKKKIMTTRFFLKYCSFCKQVILHTVLTIFRLFSTDSINSSDSLLAQQTCYSEGVVMLNANV